MADPLQGRVPVILIVDDEEWRARSLESILGPQGFAVVKAYTGRQALDLARRLEPDLVIADYRLPHYTGPEVIRRLREQSAAEAALPCIIVSGTVLGRSERRECLEAGAWEILTAPIDPDEILLKCRTFVAAKRRGDLTSFGVRDTSGYYNLRGLIARVEEIASDADRSRRPMACVVIGMAEDDDGTTERTVELFQDLRAFLRTSDVVGHLSHDELAVVAPGTGADGAQMLAERIANHMLAHAGSQGEAMPLRLGLCTISPEEIPGIREAPEEVLSRAVKALRSAHTQGPVNNRIRSFDHL